MRHLLLLIISFLSVICGCTTKRNSLSASDYKVVIWDKGKKTEVKSSANNEQIQEAIIQIVNHSDDMFKLIVTEQHMKELRKTNKCLEITLSSPLSTSIGKTNVTFTRLLIPINNDSNTETIVIYLADNKTYYTPPYISTHGKTDLKKLVELLNIFP